MYYLECSGSFPEASADLQSQTGTVVPFGEETTFFPGDEYVIPCAMERGGDTAARYARPA